MISRSTPSGATRIAIALATARIALSKNLQVTKIPMFEFEYVTMKFEKFDKIYYVFLEQTLQKF